MHSNLQDQPSTLGSNLLTLELNVEGVEDRRKLGAIEVDVDDGTNNLLDGSDLVVGSAGVGSVGNWQTRNSRRSVACFDACQIGEKKSGDPVHHQNETEDRCGGIDYLASDS